MSQIESLLAEFEREARTTRRHLERLPADKLDWRPHPKSYTAGALASHLVDCLRWTEAIFGGDELDLDPAAYQPFGAESPADLLAAFDRQVAACRDLLAGATDGALARPWRLKVRSRQLFERQRAVVFRDMTLSHIIHHRGQLSVYLRLLDVPVPGSYGPTADEGA
jgi:uncharacterized damage-inducible protein DinB